MTHLSLFSGIGGLDLAAEAAGFETVGQCEWADYPTKVLEKHWPDVPRWRDIRTLTEKSFYEKTGWRTVDVISGGFPCQPFSVAGQRRGEEDDRYLWPEMLRVIQEIRPAWVVGENVAGIVNMALDTVLSDLENIGYSCQAFIIPACAVDAPHRRDRCAIVAYASGKGLQRLQQPGALDEGEQQPESCGSTGKCGEAFRDADGGRRERIKRREYVQLIEKRRFWTTEPNVGRVVNGVPNRVDRVKCLGNAVVPQQFYPIFKAIAEIERGGKEKGEFGRNAEPNH